MLKIEVGGEIEATWNDETTEWQSDDKPTEDLLRAHFDAELAPDMSPRDIYLEKGASGKVWEAVRASFGALVALVELVPETLPKELKGYDY